MQDYPEDDFEGIRNRLEAVAIALDTARKSGANIPPPKKIQPYGKRS